ncbi:nuclear transport factor 2 family protein [Rhodococcus rhodochrous]|uniref:Nuclear transport factor 2 family protein n=1 Tax=Rhodococcus rhodochrous TaxID=1829 RepID=A0AAW4XN87_RHORH|nr:nuclear transport factor 2 family protein [Rhodococcus rhodochrous]MCD2114650.1 nuclear transport factor 2 family protein [Rhodococcus rhodochrous]
MTDSDTEAMLIERRIEQVLLRYTRAADRLDVADMQSCYWPGAVDWHGEFRGSVEEFVPWVECRLSAFDRTMHHLTNIRIEVGDSGDVARVESYLVAFHRFGGSESDPVEMYLGLRYVDRFEARAGEWRIAARVCSYEWKREISGRDPGFGPSHVLGSRGADDVLHWIMDLEPEDPPRG